MILNILQLAVHNLEIDWEKEKVKIMQCLSIYKKKSKKHKRKSK